MCLSLLRLGWDRRCGPCVLQAQPAAPSSSTCACLKCPPPSQASDPSPHTEERWAGTNAHKDPQLRPSLCCHPTCHLAPLLNPLHYSLQAEPSHGRSVGFAVSTARAFPELKLHPFLLRHPLSRNCLPRPTRSVRWVHLKTTWWTMSSTSCARSQS